MTTANFRTWSKRSKLVSFLPVDDYGRYSIPVHNQVYKKIKGRGQMPAHVASIAMHSYASQIVPIPMGRVKDMTRVADPFSFTKVRTTVERFVAEAACFSLLSRTDNFYDFTECWMEFSSVMETMSQVIKRTSLVTGLPQREGDGSADRKFREENNIIKAPTAVELEIENARRHAARAMRKIRNEELKAIRASLLGASEFTGGGVVRRPENEVKKSEQEVFDPDLLLWSIKEN